MSSDNLPSHSADQADYVNYNIRFHPIAPAPSIPVIAAWIRANGIDARLFDTYDGGGSTGLILECTHLQDLLAFQRTFLDSHHRHGWAEDASGARHRFCIEADEVVFAGEGE